MLDDFGAMKSYASHAAPKVIGVIEAATTLGISCRSWRRLVDAGLAPQPVRLGRRVLWRVDELDAWLAAGCPSIENLEVSR
jgi:predicted DNA-binding transcriptional regulator AlpA